MGNLARKLHEEQWQKQHNVAAPKKVKIRTPLLSPGEKILGLVFGIAVCFGSYHIISNQATIYSINKSVQQMESSIASQKKVNTDLKIQVSELSTYDRIWAKAKALGLKLNENNVKVVQDK